jgi:hypothetical protein
MCPSQAISTQAPASLNVLFRHTTSVERCI